MTQINASAFGTTVLVKASTTFPNGILLSQFADDADSLDLPEATVADSGMGINGTHVVWAKPIVIDVTVNLVPGSVDDTNMAILLNANRQEEGKRIAYDQLTLVINYPDGGIVTLAEGIIVSGNLGKSIAQSGRVKTRAYKMRFTKLR